MANEGASGKHSGAEKWVNTGEQTWHVLRHEWKYRPAAAAKKDFVEEDKERKERSKQQRVDLEVIYNDLTTRRGQVPHK